MDLKGCGHLRVLPCAVVQGERRFVIVASHLSPTVLGEVIRWRDGEGSLPEQVHLFDGEGLKVALLLQEARLSYSEIAGLSRAITRWGYRFLLEQSVADHF